MIPFCDLKKQYLSIEKEMDAAIKKVLKKAQFILGDEVEALEREIAFYLGCKYASGVASGTDALVLALLASGIKKGDEVITTPLTFVATIEAIVRAGGRPVFADVDIETYNINPREIQEKITGKTFAILPVHLYGHPADMDELKEIAQKNKLKILEDCAQSMGAEYRGMKTGGLGACGCLSFFPAKNLGCYGDGGMVVTNSKKIFEKVKILRSHGCRIKNFQSMRGFNSRLDAIQAAVLRVKLRHLEKWIKMRNVNAAYYSHLLSGISEIETPFTRPFVRHGFNYYTVRIKSFAGARDFLMDYLNSNGVSCGVYYPRVQHLQKAYRNLGYRRGDFPISEKLQNEILTLPMFPELSKKQIEFTVNKIKNGLAKRR